MRPIPLRPQERPALDDRRARRLSPSPLDLKAVTRRERARVRADRAERLGSQKTTREQQRRVSRRSPGPLAHALRDSRTAGPEKKNCRPSPPNRRSYRWEQICTQIKPPARKSTQKVLNASPQPAAEYQLDAAKRHHSPLSLIHI